MRRLISFSLSSLLKNSFEQVFTPPIIVESIFAELGENPTKDSLARLHYDGDHQYSTSRVVVAHRETPAEAEAAEWITKALAPGDSLMKVASVCLTAWQVLNDGKNFQALAVPGETQLQIPGKVIEAALLDRQRPGPVHYRPLELK